MIRVISDSSHHFMTHDSHFLFENTESGVKSYDSWFVLSLVESVQISKPPVPKVWKNFDIEKKEDLILLQSSIFIGERGQVMGHRWRRLEGAGLPAAQGAITSPDIGKRRLPCKMMWCKIY